MAGTREPREHQPQKVQKGRGEVGVMLGSGKLIPETYRIPSVQWARAMGSGWEWAKMAKMTKMSKIIWQCGAENAQITRETNEMAGRNY